MSRVEQRRLGVSGYGEDYKSLSALNMALDAFVKVVEVGGAHVFNNCRYYKFQLNSNPENHLDSHTDQNEDHVDKENYGEGNEVEEDINTKKISPKIFGE